MGRHLLRGLLAGTVVVACPRAAGAMPRTRFEYVVDASAAGCAGEDAIRASVVERIGYDPFAADAPAVLRVRVVKAAELEGRIEAVDAGGVVTGSRQLASSQADCAELQEALTLAIAIAVDPRTALHPPGEGHTGSDDRSDLRQAPPRSAEALSASAHPLLGIGPSESAPVHVELGAGAVSGFGLSPQLADLGLRMLGEMQHGAWSLVMGASAHAPVTSEATDGRVRSTVWYGTVAPCWRPAQWGGCAVFSLGALKGEGLLVDHVLHDAATYVAAGAEVTFDWRYGERSGLRFFGQVLGNVRPVSLRLNGATAWSLPPVAANIGVMWVGRLL